MSSVSQQERRLKKLVIIGSGPAGYTAAIYAARAQIEPVLIDGSQPGGQLTITNEIENFPGFPEGISGTGLMDLCRKQAARFNTEFIGSQVTEVDFSSSPLRLKLGNGNSLECLSVIIATGAGARFLGLPSEKKLMGRGVSACATCDGFFYRDLDVAVVGGGDTAIEEALFLTKFAARVTVIHRRDTLRASKILRTRAMKNEKIDFAWNSIVREIKGDEKNGVTGLILSDVKTGEERLLECRGIFIAIGHHPNTEIFKGHLELREDGYIKLIEPGTTKTSVPGVFAAGDAADSRYRQAITAAGSGCAASLDAERWLEEIEEQ